MGYWARKITAGAAWFEVSDLIPDGAIPLSVLSDFGDPVAKPSVWLVGDLEASLRRVAAAVQKGKEPSNVVFRIVEETMLAERGVRAPTRKKGGFSRRRTESTGSLRI